MFEGGGGFGEGAEWEWGWAWGGRGREAGVAGCGEWVGEEESVVGGWDDCCCSCVVGEGIWGGRMSAIVQLEAMYYNDTPSTLNEKRRPEVRGTRS